MKSSLLRIATLLTLFIAFTGCTKNVEEEAETPVTPNISLEQIKITDDGNLSIGKSELEKEFLLQASFIDQRGEIPGSPTSTGMQSRIVYFTKQKSSLFMMEALKGFVTSDELPANRILAEFKIVSEDDAKIVFDFNNGMNKIFMATDWYASDAQYGMSPPFAVSIASSFLKDLSYEKEWLKIRQITQVQFYNLYIPMEVVYYLAPYQPDPSFEPSLSPGFTRVGYFEANPQIKPDFGNLENYVAKWNVKQPIIFYISSNTPKEYIDAVREGILYWNKAFGADVVQVEIAPEGVTAPHPTYNIIQWVTNHEAGFAYADAQVDPRTGQVLHGQAYITTRFSYFSSLLFDVKQKSKDPKEESAEKEIEHPLFGLKGFQGRPLCKYPAIEFSENVLRSAAANPEVIFKLSQDYIRHVVAHEVGHVLGLRHNFAGSYGAEGSPEERSDQFDHYLLTGEIGTPLRTASSVMDYLDREERILNGVYIGDEELPAFPYDAMAIQYLYYNAPPVASLEKTLFCTDTDLGFLWWSNYEECKLFDFGSHPISAQTHIWKRNVEQIPNLLAGYYLALKEVLQANAKKVPLNAEWSAEGLVQSLESILDLFRENVNSLYVERSFPFVSDINEKEYFDATTKWINKSVSENGGVRSILDLIADASLIKTMRTYEKRFHNIIESDTFKQGVTPSGEPYQFLDSEIEAMEKNASLFFKLFEEEVIAKVTELLAGYIPNKFTYDVVIDDYPELPPSSVFRPIADLKGLEDSLAGWADHMITEGAEKKPTFDFNLRFTATNILQPFQGPKEGWQQENRKEILEKLLEKLKVRFGKPILEIDPSKLSEEELKAFQEELQIIQALGGEVPIPPPPGEEPPVHAYEPKPEGS